MQYEKNGTIYEFELDADKIADMEEANPDFDLLKELDEMDGLKFSVVRRLAGFVGETFDSLKEKGLNYKDLMEIFKGCIDDLGFSSDQPGQDSS